MSTDKSPKSVDNMDNTINKDGKEIEAQEIGLEGVDNPPDALSDTQSFNPAKIDIVTVTRTIELLLTRLKYGELDLSPDFQRKANLWDSVRKTSLIESLLLRIPLPSFYVSEDEEGNYAVVDGLQRLSAIAHFVNVEALNEASGTEKLKPLVLEAKGLRSLQELAGKTFDQLERPLQRRITETELIMHVIRSGTPGAVKFNVFSRINQGGLPLKAQEIRNAIFPGIWRDKIRELAESKEFLDATEHKIKAKRMEDMELVLRAVALHYHREPRPNDQNLEDYLNQFVEEECRNWSEEKWREVQFHIKQSLKIAPRLFSVYVFRKYYPYGGKRKPINVGLFEAQIGVLSRYTEKQRLFLKKHNFKVLLNYIRISDFREYLRFIRDMDTLEREAYLSSLDDPKLAVEFKLFGDDLSLFDFSFVGQEIRNPREIEADKSLYAGTTEATSKGLASNQRVTAMKYIFDQVLGANNND